MTLWALPATVEDQFDSHWHRWLDDRSSWSSFFEELQTLPSSDLLESLQHFGLLSSPQIGAAQKLRPSAEGRAVPISGTYTPDNEILALLAAGFAKGLKGKPAIPYARLDG